MFINKLYEVKQCNYKYILIIPHKSIRNYNSSNIAKAIALTYKNVDSVIKIENGKIVIDRNKTFSYIVDITKDNCSFYFKVPEIYLNIIINKITEIWNKSTIKILDSIDIKQGTYKMYLNYKKHDALSLNVDKKSNNPLNTILNVSKIMKNDDFIRIKSDFTPISQSFWQDSYKDMLKKVKNYENLDKNPINTKNLIRVGLNGLLTASTSILEVLNDLTGQKEDKTSYYDGLFEYFNNKKELSPSTKAKKNDLVVSNSIEVYGNKKDNVILTCQSYNCINEDNELIYSSKKKENIMSVSECQNFIQIPADELLKEYNIKHINNTEIPVSKDLLKGVICIGENIFHGNNNKVYLSNDKEYKYLTLLIIAPTRAGKTTFIENIANDCTNNGECVINFDFCGECSLSNHLEGVCKDYYNIECNNINKLVGLDFCEMNCSGSKFERYKTAKAKTNMFVSWINNINTESKLEPRMLRYLKASCIIVFYNNGTFKDIFGMMENIDILKHWISKKDDIINEYIDTISEIIEHNKESDNIRFSYVSGILNRLDIIKSNAYMEFMLKSNNSINLLDYIKENRLINIKIPESMFNTDVEKDIYCLFWCIKIWGTLQMRMNNKKYKDIKVNLLFDELYQVPLTQSFLKTKINQIAKKHCKLIISCHSLEQIKYIRPELKSANTSYMLISGCNKDNYNELKEELEPFELSDLLELKRYYSLNLIKCNNGYSKFITKLPKPIY